MHFTNSIRELAAHYNLDHAELRILTRAGKILEEKMRNPLECQLLVTPNSVRQFARNYFTVTHAYKETEVFSVAFLDNQNRLIIVEDLFFGTIDSASVYPRVVVQRALQHNAAAVLFIHNHPSGNAEPSRADRNITKRLTDALDLVDISTLDHIIIGGLDSVSFAELGLI